MEEFLYLEADEEITSVVDKLKGLEANSIGLVAPKGSTIAQSVVSLKLLKKEADNLKKEIALITSDEVGRNLASQVGLLTYADVKSQTPIASAGNKEIDELKEPLEIDMSKKTPETEKSAETEEDVPPGLAIHRYDDAKEQEAEDEFAKDDLKENKSEVVLPTQIPKEERQDSSESFIKRPVTKITPPQDREEIESARPIKFGSPKPIQKPSTSKKRKIIITSAIVLGVILLVLAADLLLSRLEIKLLVQAETIEKEVGATVEKDRSVVDFDQSIIPGVQIQKEQEITSNYPTSGEKEEGEKAKGTLSFKNNDGGAQSINAGTIIRSSSGVNFVLDSTITVPGATVSMGNITLGKADGSVTASEAGADGNMGSSTTYSVTGKVSLTAEGGTSGGVTKIIKVVTQSDINNAEEDLKKKQVTDILSDSDRAKGLIVIENSGTMELSDFSTSKSVGDEAEEFSAKAKAKYTTIAFKLSDLKDVVVKSIEKNLAEGKGLLLTETDTFSPTLKESQINTGKLLIVGSLKSHIGPKMNLSNLETSWRLKPIKKIRDSLSGIQGVNVQSIELWPSYTLPLAPALTRNINVNLEYVTK